MNIENITRAPALDCDKLEGCEPDFLGLHERAIVWNLLAHLYAAGFIAIEVWSEDNEEVAVNSAREAMEAAFCLADNFSICAQKPGFEPHYILFVQGNAEAIVSNWGYYADDCDGFNAAMTSFDASAVGPALMVQS